MSRGINKVILIGNLGGDPDTRFLPNGNAVTNITLATSDSWRDRQTGQMQERTEWHRVTFFGKIAEIAGQYLRKGSKVYVEGRLQTREWEKDGIKRYTTEVIVDMGGTMQMLDSRGVVVSVHLLLAGSSANPVTTATACPAASATAASAPSCNMMRSLHRITIALMIFRLRDSG